jgi:heme/copper-type cytochrome/quinol oxidase subunit 4
MNTIDKGVLKKNRKTALLLALGTILILQIIIYIILKTISDQKGQLIALAISTLVLVTFIIIFGKYRKRKAQKSPSD